MEKFQYISETKSKSRKESPNLMSKDIVSKSPYMKHDQISKGLQYIFTFYAKQQKLVKGGCTFEDYHEDSTTLSIGEFLVFCRDFQLTSQEKLSKKELINIFQVNCSFRKEMTEHEFLQTLNHLSAKLFSEPSKENYTKLLNYLKVDDLDSVKRTCKGFSQPFFSDKHRMRSPPSKIKLPSNMNLPRVSSLVIPRFRSTKNSKKAKKDPTIPCDAVITNYKKSGYAGAFKRATNLACTWQTLSSLSAEQVADGNKIFDLIEEKEDSDDDILEKMYGSLRGNSKSKN